MGSALVGSNPANCDNLLMIYINCSILWNENFIETKNILPCLLLLTFFVDIGFDFDFDVDIDAGGGKFLSLMQAFLGVPLFTSVTRIC